MDLGTLRSDINVQMCSLYIDTDNSSPNSQLVRHTHTFRLWFITPCPAYRLLLVHYTLPFQFTTYTPYTTSEIISTVVTAHIYNPDIFAIAEVKLKVRNGRKWPGLLRRETIQ